MSAPKVLLKLKLKDGREVSGRYSAYEAVARIHEAARQPDFEDFTVESV